VVKEEIQKLLGLLELLNKNENAFRNDLIAVLRGGLISPLSAEDSSEMFYSQTARTILNVVANVEGVLASEKEYQTTIRSALQDVLSALPSPPVSLWFSPKATSSAECLTVASYVSQKLSNNVSYCTLPEVDTLPLFAKANLLFVDGNETLYLECLEKKLEVVKTLTWKYPGATSVSVAGSFNHWKPQLMQWSQHGNFWELNCHIPPGTHKFKYFVNNGEWCHDPDQSIIQEGNIVNNAIEVVPDHIWVLNITKDRAQLSSTNLKKLILQPPEGGLAELEHLLATFL